MVGGGIFSILGVSVGLIGAYTPFAIALGGLIASLAAYSYVKLGVYYKDEGATYAFFKRTFPRSPFAASAVGWIVSFGYISTLALYAYTFASYAISGFAFADSEGTRKGVAGGIILLFTIINVWSVKGMGKIEDLMVYTKIVVLLIISFVLMLNSRSSIPVLLEQSQGVSFVSILICASLTFVAYEGFQLVIHAIKEMDQPEKKIPRAIYSAIFLAILIYVVIALGALFAIPMPDIVAKKEYALAAGANDILGHWGTNLVILGALLATSSAISGTVFGASRLVASIADDGYFPRFLTKRPRQIPVFAVLVMSAFAFSLILMGNLEVILEFGSFTFLFVSLMTAYANFKIRDKTDSSIYLTLASLVGLGFGSFFIFYYEVINHPEQLLFIGIIYACLIFGSWFYSKIKAI
jgi:amino acid transporter